jgi:hypothetical protein
MQHNDYVQTVESYLRRYREFSTYVENVKADIADIEEQLKLSAAPKVPSLSFTPGGSGENTSPQEKEYLRKEKLHEKESSYRADLAQIEPMLKRLNRSVEALTDTDRKIIWARYIDGLSWEMVAYSGHCSVGFCRKRCREVLEILACMMFGPGAIPVQTKFVFYGKR